MKKLIATSAAVLTLATGGLAVAAVNPFTGAGAAEPEPTATTQPDATAPAQGGERPRILEGVLEGLVEDGTLTQEQSTAVTDGVKARISELRAEKGEGGNRHRRGHGAVLETAATTIGISKADLVAALKEGDSIADVAAANDVERQAVVDALVAKGEARIAEAVAAGKLTEERAAKATERLVPAAERIVDATRTR